MYIANARRGLIGGDQTASGDFLIVLCRGKQLRGIVRSVKMRQCGHFMMARVENLDITLSGTYGDDGLPVSADFGSKGSHLWDVAVPLPEDLTAKFWAGGGHNSAGSEAPAVRAWALANVRALKRVRYVAPWFATVTIGGTEERVYAGALVRFVYLDTLDREHESLARVLGPAEKDGCGYAFVDPHVEVLELSSSMRDAYTRYVAVSRIVAVRNAPTADDPSTFETLQFFTRPILPDAGVLRSMSAEGGLSDSYIRDSLRRRGVDPGGKCKNGCAATLDNPVWFSGYCRECQKKEYEKEKEAVHLKAVVHLLKTRGGSECGQDGQADPDIERVTCPTCVSRHEAIQHTISDDCSE